jgi:putative SOS response-associated peptidase YedK
MCGRYASKSSSKELQTFFDTMQTVGDELPPSYSVAPHTIGPRDPRTNPTRGTRSEVFTTSGSAGDELAGHRPWIGARIQL